MSQNLFLPSNESPNAAPHGTKRRSSSILSSGDDAKKTRGRPRVEPLDETAADRRRTQIRIAQRTYRQRKESTITTLQTKVSQLETIIHEMHASFEGVKQDALTSKVEELSPSFARRFADATRKFDQLARDAKVEKKVSRTFTEDSQSDDGEQVKKPRRGRASKAAARTSGSGSKDVPKEPAPTIVSESQRGVPSVWGYETIYDGTPELDDADDTSIETAGDDAVEAIPSASVQLLPPATVSIGTLAIPDYSDQAVIPLTSNNMYQFQMLTPDLELPLPPSISFQEMSFGRRLHRTVLEAAHRLLNAPYPDPKKLERKFSHVMRYQNQQEIAQSIYGRLLRSKSEPLESNFDYPSVDYFGPYGIQEWKIPAEYQSEIDFLTNEDTAGDGAWFTPKDVQTYLEAKGVYIQPTATVTQWETDVVTPRISRGHSPASNYSDPAFYGTPASLDSSTFDSNGVGGSTGVNSNVYLPTYSNDKGPLFPNPFMPSPSMDVFDKPLERRHKRMTIDVNVLLAGK